MASVGSYVELSAPLFEDVVAASDEPTVVVPLLLSTGFHVRQDLPRWPRRRAGPLLMGRQLGPHRLLAEAPAGAAARGRRGARRRPAGDGRGRLQRRRWRPATWTGRPSCCPGSGADAVEVATLSARGRRPAEVVRPGDVVSPYLLSPGFFADRARDESRAAGAEVVADVMGPHPLVVDLVVRRARALL